MNKKPKTVTINKLAAITHIDRRTIKKRLDAAGLKPRKCGLYSEYDLSAALEASKPPTTEDTKLRDAKTIEEIRKLKLQNDRTSGKLIPLAYVLARHNAIGSRVASILRQKLEIEYPNAAAGLDVRGARVYGKRLFDQIMLEFQKLGDVFET